MCEGQKKRGRPYKLSRNAAIYDAYIMISGKTGGTAYFVLSHLAAKTGISKERIYAIIKKERERREAGL